MLTVYTPLQGCEKNIPILFSLSPFPKVKSEILLYLSWPKDFIALAKKSIQIMRFFLFCKENVRCGCTLEAPQFFLISQRKRTLWVLNRSASLFLISQRKRTLWVLIRSASVFLSLKENVRCGCTLEAPQFFLISQRKRTLWVLIRSASVFLISQRKRTFWVLIRSASVFSYFSKKTYVVSVH